MRTVILGDPPPEIEALITSRRSTGADRRDEIWEGDYHMNPAPRPRHAYLVAQLIELLGPRARELGLMPLTDFNIGVENDVRIPDAGLLPELPDTVYVPTAPFIVEVLSPHDETMEKLPFYAAHGVGEVVIVDPTEQRITWLELIDAEYQSTRRSTLLDVDVAEFSASIEWP